MTHGAPIRKKPLANGEPAPDDNDQPIPPDGGWGWMVVLGSFMIHIITDGFTYSFGLFYKPFELDFNEGQGYTAWIASVLVGVTLASGPISSSFVNRYGCRTVTIAGAILSACSLAVSALAKNVFTLIITIGLGTGLGFGLIYLPAIVSVTQYFEAKRSLATGIAVCGSGFGTFVFSPLTNLLIKHFQWRGTLLIMAAIMLSCIIFGALFRPLKKSSANNTKKFEIRDANELQPLNVNNKQYVIQNKTDLVVRSNSLGHAYEYNYNNNSNGYSNGKVQTPNSTNEVSQDIVRSAVSQPHLCEIEAARLAELKKTSASGTMYRPDIFYQGSLLNIPEYTHSRNNLSSKGGANRYGFVKKRMHRNNSNESINCCTCVSCSRETRDTFREMMNFSLLCDGVFTIFIISNFCTSIGLNTPYLYIVNQASSLGINEDYQSYLLAVIGISNTISRIVLGYFSDYPRLNRQWLYNSCLTICGLATIFCPFCTSFWKLSIYCAVFGFTIGAYVGLTSVILVDLLGLDKLTNAFGLLLLFQGIASFIGPPIGGFMYDITKSYNPAFYLAGSMILVSGLIMFAIPLVQKRKVKETCQNTTTNATLS